MPSEITLPAGDAREEQAALTAKDEYVPLFPLLADYWDKTLSELPEALQTRVNGRVVKRFIGYRPKFDANGELARGAERSLHVQATTALAACERLELDGIAATCVAMKRDGVKRLR
jgi:hypothetical protein